MLVAGCGHAPARHAKPRCDALRRSARHELGDPRGEIETHCRRD